MKHNSILRLLYRLPGLRQCIILATARRIRVRGESMAPALRPGDYVLFDTLAYRFEPQRPGDVVVARHPARPGVNMIKRVSERKGDELWLLGDNAPASTDSRQLGAFKPGDVLGKGWFIYWPPDRMRRL